MIGVIGIDLLLLAVTEAIWTLTYYLGSFLLTMLYIFI